MPTDGRIFTVVIHSNEYKQICAWVLKHETLETGGDLFGLWAGDRTAVIQLVLGPGQGCRRASHSFYQDVSYLEKVGTHLTEEEGICHIGEWHSHHTIGLKRPSGGDEGTVWRNMPTYGLSRFLLFIANIESPSHCEVSVGCFLFECEKATNMKLRVLQGRFRLLPDASPFRSKLQRTNVLKDGAEDTNHENEIANLCEILTDANERDSMRPIMGSRHRQGRHATARSRRDHPVELSKRQDRTFTVAIYANEYKQICAWVLKKPTLETGGDLFGLWAEDRTAVIQLVLGPGRGCQRAANSFYQDVPYLEKVGGHLTEEKGICHIGEWHSHHTIGLRQPSEGDQRTVWRNMPAYGLSRFLLFIANIESGFHSSVSVGCFLFEFEKGTKLGLSVLQGRFQLLPDQSPFRQLFLPSMCGVDNNLLEDGAESMNSEDVIAALEEESRHAARRDAMRPIMGCKNSSSCHCIML